MTRGMWTVYRKELLDVLRDRRTILAMIIVPLLMYPGILMLGLQAAVYEQGQRQQDRYVIATADAGTLAWVQAVLAADAQPRDAQPRDALPGDAEPRDAQPGPEQEPETQPAGGGRGPGRPGMLGPMTIEAEQFVAVLATAQPADAAPATPAAHDAQIAVIVTPTPDPNDPLDFRINREVTVRYNAADHRSQVAWSAFVGIVARHANRLLLERVQAAGLPADTLEPISVIDESIATAEELGGFVLANFLPFLLVIMTVTGAIHPAIDLTVGERERGTLETLLAAPVPPSTLMLGKFLVVTTIAVLTSVLNLLSIAATVFLGGIATAAAAENPIAIPLASLPLVLVALVPLAVLFSAAMLVACSFARSFKEAQNYMMPVVMAGMLPALAASMAPSITLDGGVILIPVANVVVLLRDMFLGRVWGVDGVVPAGVVLVTTALYATGAVLLAARLFGQEAVMFADVSTYRSMLTRRMQPRRRVPPVEAGVLLIAFLFPATIYWQTAMMSPEAASDDVVQVLIVQMLGILLAPALLLTWWLRADFVETFRLRAAPGRAWLATLLLVPATPVLAIALHALQQAIMPAPPELARGMEELGRRLAQMPLLTALMCFAVLPAVCEEALFRGLALSSLRPHVSAAAAILLTSLAFGLFHVDVSRVVITGLLGAILGVLALRGGSIYPAIVLHFTHNASAVLLGRVENQTALEAWLTEPVLIGGAVALLIVAMISLASTPDGRPRTTQPITTRG